MKPESNDSNKADMLDIYDLYVTFYEKYHKNKNLFFSKQRWSELFSCLSKGRRDMWRVVGITPNALLHYEQNSFKKNTRGLVRGHINMRIKTFDIFFEGVSMLSYDQFWTFIKECDPVVLMTKEENKSHDVPKFIHINNDDGSYFSNDGTNWKLTDRDVALLKVLKD